MTPLHTTKGKRRYRYYVSVSDTPDRKMPADGWRIPAGEVEPLVRTKLTGWLQDEVALVGLLSKSVEPNQLQSGLAAYRELANRATDMPTSQWRKLLLGVDAHVHILDEKVVIEFDPLAAAGVGGGTREQLSMAAKLTRRGQELRLAYSPRDRDAPANHDVKLIGLIAKAEASYRTLVSGAAIDPIKRNHLVRMARLKFLAPDITGAILEGSQPVTLSARKLLREACIPHCWQAQREMLGFA